MLNKAKIAILVGSVIAIVSIWFPDLGLEGYADTIVAVIMKLLPLFGAGVAFYHKSETVESVYGWVDTLTFKDVKDIRE